MANIKVTICGFDELALHRESGVTHVLSILDPGWPIPVEFESWDRHEKMDMRFHDVIEDGGEMEPPSADQVEEILEFGRKLPLNRSIHLLVHCHGGISRSTASAILLLAQRDPAREPDDIVRQIANHRPQTWPNLRIIELGDHFLQREGRLIKAARRRYREVLAIRPELAEERRAEGRGREVDG